MGSPFPIYFCKGRVRPLLLCQGHCHLTYWNEGKVKKLTTVVGLGIGVAIVRRGQSCADLPIPESL